MCSSPPARYILSMTTARELLPFDAFGRRRLKIAFVGTHGVGKTTLCFDLAAQLKRLDLGVDLVKEVARRCPLPINENTTPDAQAWILHTQIAEELEASATYEVVICDRSVLDNYAYLVARAGRQADLDPLVGKWIRTYDALFKVPVISLPSYDGTRAVSPAFQLEIDGVIEKLLADFAVDVVSLGADDRDRWIPTVMHALGMPSRPPQIDLFVPGSMSA
jgi:nicotinamide riboside kinase